MCFQSPKKTENPTNSEADTHIIAAPSRNQTPLTGRYTKMVASQNDTQTPRISLRLSTSCQRTKETKSNRSAKSFQRNRPTQPLFLNRWVTLVPAGEGLSTDSVGESQGPKCRFVTFFSHCRLALRSNPLGGAPERPNPPLYHLRRRSPARRQNTSRHSAVAGNRRRKQKCRTGSAGSCKPGGP